MKTTTALVVAAGLAALAACNQSPQENAAENIEANADNVSENIEMNAENASENVQANAENAAENVENTADGNTATNNAY